MTRRQALAALGCGPAVMLRAEPPDISLRISEINLELAPKRIVRTLAFNGAVPGPLLRASEGQTITVEISNQTKDPEMTHWHGFHIPSDVDGVHEEGTPHIPAKGSRSYTFTARPAGTRWYHSHVHSGRNLRSGTYSGQFGMFVIEARNDPGRYDAEVPILLHEWDPYLSMEGGMDVEYRLFSINGKMLGAGEPVRVRPGQRVLFRLLNASATLEHRLALSGHTFRVIALDGAPVATPREVRAVEIAPGERIDAIVEMNNPGIWILGDTQDRRRAAGLGIVIEYADRSGAPRWDPPSPIPWDYTIFGGAGANTPPDATIPLVFRQPEGTHRWTINGKSFPQTEPLRVSKNQRVRLVFDNQSAEPHPVHLHRHTFELVRVADKPTSGVFKDVVVVPPWKQVEADFPAVNPGPTLFHCHQQFHMDNGFMAMMQYRD